MSDCSCLTKPLLPKSRRRVSHKRRDITSSSILLLCTPSTTQDTGRSRKPFTLASWSAASTAMSNTRRRTRRSPYLPGGVDRVELWGTPRLPLTRSRLCRTASADSTPRPLLRYYMMIALYPSNLALEPPMSYKSVAMSLLSLYDSDRNPRYSCTPYTVYIRRLPAEDGQRQRQETVIDLAATMYSRIRLVALCPHTIRRNEF